MSGGDWLLDRSFAGRRIKLHDTTNKYSILKRGDMGTVRYIYKNYNNVNVVVKWDSGGETEVTFGIDQFEILEDRR